MGVDDEVGSRGTGWILRLTSRVRWQWCEVEGGDGSTDCYGGGVDEGGSGGEILRLGGSKFDGGGDHGSSAWAMRSDSGWRVVAVVVRWIWF